MAQWHNPSGRPLSSADWLLAHHQAKLLERRAFAQSVLSSNPERIVDLGCGPGYWLSIFDSFAKSDCELIGIDLDATALAISEQSAKQWHRRSSFQQLDLDVQSDQLPDADVYLAFNTFSYLKRPVELLKTLRERVKDGAQVIIRQYDGGMFRFGPIAENSRREIDASLWASTAYSQQFNHYDLDALFGEIYNAGFPCQSISFETFSRCAPYPKEFLPYFRNSLEWVMDNVSDAAARLLKEWCLAHLSTEGDRPSYFTEVDIVAWLS